MRKTVFVPFLLLFASPFSGAGQTLEIAPVADIEPRPLGRSSNPTNFYALGRFTLFQAGASELYSTDGTAVGTQRLTSICSGCFVGNAWGFALGRAFYTFASPERTGPVLVATGGRLPSTRIVAEGVVPAGGFTELAGRQRAVFRARSKPSAPGFDLWVTDGTRAGTLPLTAFTEGTSMAPVLVVFGGHAYFTVFEAEAGPTVWRTDGTVQGTTRWLDPEPRSSRFFASLQPLGVVRGKLVLLYGDSRTGLQWWTSDGTVRGTRLAVDLLPGAKSPTLSRFGIALDRLFYVAEVGRGGQELWVTDLTPRGTRVLTRFSRPDAFSNSETAFLPNLQPTLGGRLLFYADDGPHGAEPWVTDGTAKGTQILADACPGSCSGVQRGLIPTVDGDRVWLRLFDDEHGSEYWLTDGTPAHTGRVADLCPGPCSGAGSAVGPLRGRQLLFGFRDEEPGGDFFLSDGTEAGTSLVTDAHFRLEGGVGGVAGGRYAAFSAGPPETGVELWKTDGTAEGTGLVADLAPEDDGGSVPDEFVSLGSRAVFLASDEDHGREVWVTDGSTAGTRLFAEIVPGPEPRINDVRLVEAVELGGRVLLAMTLGGGTSGGLWATDGTPEGLVRLLDVAPANLVPLGGRVFAPAGTRLYATDGTPAGTTEIPDSAFSAAQRVFAVGTRLVGSNGRNELFASVDGTLAQRVSLLPPGSAISGLPQVHGEEMFFVTFTDRVELWRSDGTPPGTVAVARLPEVEPGDVVGTRLAVTDAAVFVFLQHSRNGPALWSWRPTDPAPRSLPMGFRFPAFEFDVVVAGSRLFFKNGTPECVGIGASDGTPEGTRSVCAPGIATFGLTAAALDGGVLVNASDAVVEPAFLWTDGTEEGTVRVISPALIGGPLLSLGDRVLFRGSEPLAGSEPWSVVKPE